MCSIPLERAVFRPPDLSPRASEYAERMLSSAAVCAKARELGFELCGVAAAHEFPELTRLREWLDRGFAGEMTYLHRSADARQDIRQFLPSARSVIVTGSLYYAEADAPRDVDPSTESVPARIARYAWGRDYHRVLEARLGSLVAWMREQSEQALEARIFVDKHHVQERVFARRAGLGWIGKNTCLINPELGSWVLLAGVALSCELEPNEVVEDRCGACTMCLDACPTGALSESDGMDARRCVSYLTIEHQGSIAEELRALIGDHAYGCDICQEVCPYNLAPLATLDPVWQPRAGRARPDAAELWQRSDDALHQLVKASAMERVSLSRLRRNLAVVIGNAGQTRATEVLNAPGRAVVNAAHSAQTALVREHVEWARHQGSGVRGQASGVRLQANPERSTALPIGSPSPDT